MLSLMSFACLIIITVINCISVQFSSVRSFVGSPRSPLGLLHTFFTPVSFLVTGSTLISAAVAALLSSAAGIGTLFSARLSRFQCQARQKLIETQATVAVAAAVVDFAAVVVVVVEPNLDETKRERERERRAKSSLQLRGKGQLHVCLVRLCAVCMCVPVCVRTLFDCVCVSR